MFFLLAQTTRPDAVDGLNAVILTVAMIVFAAFALHLLMRR